MTFTRNGVLYKSADELAEEYGYTPHHIRNLARLGSEGKPGGLSGFRKGRKWWLRADAVESVLITKEFDGTESKNGKKASRKKPEADGYDCLDDI